MLVPSEEDFEESMKLLDDAGFQHTPWSYATVDPKILDTDPITQRLHASGIRGYQRLDAHSVRYQFPPSLNCEEKVVLLQSSYVHLSPPTDSALSSSTHTLPASPSTSHFYVNENLYYPDEAVLLESFIKVILEDKDTGYLKTWQTLLKAWAISYVYGELDVDDDALEVCEDADVKSWFNKAIKRDQGGLDRTVTKRKGRIEAPRTDHTFFDIRLSPSYIYRNRIASSIFSLLSFLSFTSVVQKLFRRKRQGQRQQG